MMVGPQKATAALRIRAGAPSTAAPRIGALEAGSIFFPEAEVVGEAVAGNATWFQLPQNRFVWGGACKPAPAGTGLATSFPANRRPDGTLKPLSRAAIEAVFGKFEPREKGGGRIEIPSSWTDEHLVDIDTPVLDAVGPARMTVHAKAAGPFTRVFAAIAAAGLEDTIKSYGGCWVPRHMGWNPARALSSHSWGIAIDLNVPWNGYGRMPAALGTIGSVREIVGLFEAEGFAWGGYFSPLSICDGMHFELARSDL